MCVCCQNALRGPEVADTSAITATTTLSSKRCLAVWELLGLLDQGDNGSSREVSKAEWVNLLVTPSLTHVVREVSVGRVLACGL